MAAVDSRYEDGKFLVGVTNDMLEQVHVPDRVSHWREINAHIWLTLFEAISGEPLRDVIRPMRTKEDQIHNVQAVIDTLSLDILHISLSHITGEDVVAINKRAIGNLLEVVLGLMEFVLEHVGRDTSSRATDDDSELVEDPDLVTGELIDEILEKELSKKCNISDISRQSAPEEPPTMMSRSDNKNTGKDRRPEDTTGNSTADLIALGRSSLDDLSEMSANNTADLVALGDSRYARQSPPKRGPSRTYPTTKDSLTNNYTNTLSGYTRPESHVGRSRDHQVGNSSDWDRVNGPEAPSPPHGGTHWTSASPAKTLSSQLDSSVASSAVLPQHPAASGVPPSTEFAGLGLRPRSTGSQLLNGASGSVFGGQSALLGGVGGSSITHHLYHHFDKPADRAGVNLPDFSSSLPLETSGARGHTAPQGRTERTDGLSTMPVNSVRASERGYSSGLSSSTRPDTLGGRAHSYDNLQNLMHDTVAMSRAAVRTSPLRKSPTEQPADAAVASLRSSVEMLNINMNSNQQSAPQRGTKTRPRPESAASNSKSMSAPVSPKGICSPARKDKADRANKKVSFRVSRSSDQSQSASLSSDNSSRLKMKDSDHQPGRPRQSNTSPHGATYPGPPTTTTTTRSRAARSLFTMPATTNHKPQTFAEYLDKYYGILNERDRLETTGDEDGTAVIAHSDSALEFSDASPGRADEYSGDADVSEDVEAEILRQAARLPRTVRFKGVETHAAPGRMNNIRQKLSTESKATRAKAQALARLYQMDLGDFEGEYNDQMKSTRNTARDKDRDYKKKVLRQPKTNKCKPSKKHQTSVLRPRVRTRSSSAQPHSRKMPVSRARKRSASASPAVSRARLKKTVQVGDDDLLPWLLEEFPFLHLSKQTLHELWSKSTRQMEQLTRAQQEVRRKKTKGQLQIEESLRRHTILKDIMKKELTHNQRMKEMKERQMSQQSVRTQIQNRRMQSARARRYYDEFQVRNRSRMLKKKTREELVFKKLFKDGLEIQKDRIREMRHYAKEDRQRRAEKEQDELEAIENYYRDQFAMISEVISRERQDIQIKDAAQTKVVDRMKKELRQKMESEIKTFQEQLYRDEDEEYFRQLDADRLREHLQLCRYQASV